MEDFFKIDEDQLGRAANFNLHLFVPFTFPFHDSHRICGKAMPVILR